MKKIVQLPAAAICLTGCFALPLSHAEDLPLWEVGAGVGGVTFPDYRGSDERSSYVIPVPYFIYRGEFFKADRNGLRSTLFGSDKLEVNLSLNATLPVNSKDNDARRGMSDLRPTIEFGPTINANLWHSQEKKMKLEFRAPVRTSITLESSPKQIGWLFSPSLNLDVEDPAGMAGWKLGFLAGPLFNSRKYNDYFYTVNAADATASRPAYSAKSGYSGSQFTMALSKRFPSYWIGGFLRYDTLAGAVFNDSPLVKQQSAVSAGIGITWVFKESSTRVNVEEQSLID